MQIDITVTGSEFTPERQRDGDAGYDLRSRRNTTIIPPGETIPFGTGVHAAIPRGYAGLILPRSGLACKHNVTLANSPGLMDSNYRGEIICFLHNQGSQHFMVEPMSRIAQLVIIKVEDIDFNIVQELDTTERGAGGFGSSGNK